jgi:putative spermidine/putrescine transport system ATP-binding protein
MPALSVAAVCVSSLHRSFGDVRAIDDVSFEVDDGEFFSLLGPSGSGKTTCLRLIAGFEQPEAGTILIHGQNVTGIPPYRRDVNTVFQDYALFPHLTVSQNVEYSLMIRKVPAAERRRRADEMLALVKLAGLGSRKPAQLSGGQRQRVALARALINHPRVLLLDEPLGALDLKLREQMQVELKALQRQVGITFIYVTHDQGEALSMSDRLAVFNCGRIEQTGTPAEIYEHPATAFVAGFVGVSNVCGPDLARRLTGADQPFTIRPEKIRLVDGDGVPGEGLLTATGVVEGVLYLGAAMRYTVALDGGGQLLVVVQNTDDAKPPWGPGQRVRLAWARRHQQPLR